MIKKVTGVFYWRMQRGISQYKLSDLSGVSKSLIALIELRTRALTKESAKKLARALKVKGDALNKEYELTKDEIKRFKQKLTGRPRTKAKKKSIFCRKPTNKIDIFLRQKTFTKTEEYTNATNQ